MSAPERPAGAAPQSATARPPMGVVQGGKPAAGGGNDAVEVQKLLNEVTKRLVRNPQAVLPVIKQWLTGIMQGLRGGAASPQAGPAAAPGAPATPPSGSPAPGFRSAVAGAPAAPTGAPTPAPVRR